MKYELIYQHLRRMIQSYILEVAKIDVEIGVVLKSEPIMNPFSPPDD